MTDDHHEGPPGPAPDATEINNAIRRAAGRGVLPASSPEVEPGRSEPATTAAIERVRALAAHEAGLPASMGRWVSGETPEECLADARVFAEDVARWQGQQAGGLDGGVRGIHTEPEPSFDSTIRAQMEERRSAVRRRAFDIDIEKRWN